MIARIKSNKRFLTLNFEIGVKELKIEEEDYGKKIKEENFGEERDEGLTLDNVKHYRFTLLPKCKR